MMQQYRHEMRRMELLFRAGLFASVGTQGESKPEEYESVVSDPEKSDYDPEEYNPEESDLKDEPDKHVVRQPHQEP